MCDCLQIGACVRDRAISPEPSKHCEGVRGAICTFAGVQVERRPKFRTGGEIRPASRHTNHRELLSVQQHAFADDGGIAPQALSPESLTDHNDGSRAELKIHLAEVSTERRRDVEEWKKFGRYAIAFSALRDPLSGQVSVPTLNGSEMLERCALQSPVAEVCRSYSDAVRVLLRNRLPDSHHAVQLWDAERVQEKCVDVAEDRRV